MLLIVGHRTRGARPIGAMAQPAVGLSWRSTAELPQSFGILVAYAGSGADGLEPLAGLCGAKRIFGAPSRLPR